MTRYSKTRGKNVVCKLSKARGEAKAVKTISVSLHRTLSSNKCKDVREVSAMDFISWQLIDLQRFYQDNNTAM